MGVNRTLSPRLVREIISTEEIPARKNIVNAEIVERVLRYGAPVGSTIEQFDRDDRCMDRARRLVREFEESDRSFPSGMVLLAGELTGSKGRFQRYWHAPPGGLWMTLVVVNTLLPEHTLFYPLAAGVACCETVRQYEVDAHLKWVNDVHVGGRKLAGVLTETMSGPKYGEQYILIGIGINVNNESFPEELGPLAVSMMSLLGTGLDINLFAARLLAKLAWNIGLLHYEEKTRLELADGTGREGGKPHMLLERWRQLSDSIGRKVWFGFDVQKNPQYRAEVLGIDESGGLILRHEEDGATVIEHAGEIAYID